MLDFPNSKNSHKLGQCQDRFTHFLKDNQKKLTELVDGVQFHCIISFNLQKLKDLFLMNGYKDGEHIHGIQNYKFLTKNLVIN